MKYYKKIDKTTFDERITIKLKNLIKLCNKTTYRNIRWSFFMRRKIYLKKLLDFQFTALIF